MASVNNPKKKADEYSWLVMGKAAGRPSDELIIISFNADGDGGNICFMFISQLF